MTESLYGMPVTRFEIADLIGDAFRGPALNRRQLAHVASRRGARSAVLLVLRRLPDLRYASLADLWQALPDIPDVHDPWDT